jgi:hypothetical protein
MKAPTSITSALFVYAGEWGVRCTTAHAGFVTISGCEREREVENSGKPDEAATAKDGT